MSEVGNVASRRESSNGRSARLAAVWRQGFVRSAYPFAVVVLVWWVVAGLQIFPPAFFVGPDMVFQRLIGLVQKGILTDYLADSVTRLVTGSLVALAIGIPFGYLVGLNRYVRRACMPILIFFQAISDIAWLPLLVIWFGFTLTSVNLVLIYSIVFPVVLSVVAGIDGIREDLVRAARSLGANRRQVLVEVMLPGSFAFVATGIRIGLGYGWRALIASEIIIGTSGLGYMMFESRKDSDVSTVLIGMIVLASLWYVTDTFILAPLERETVERWGLVKKVANQ